ncbi:MAG: hypothetical protein JSU86_19190 [Phycisphaerales bacterium]|nr:MAG: hypothetical protein JSU86_19190 [Phycisphaerales bacterium]
MTDLERVRDVKRRYNRELMRIPGVVGTGAGQDASGQPVIKVYVERDSPALRRKIPDTVEGVSVRIVETGRFEAR